MAEYIDKNKAINAVFEAFADGRSAYIDLEAIPAADVQPARHGRWIEIDGEWYDWQCSECGSKRDGRTPYCPNCGAVMMDKEVDNG